MAADPDTTEWLEQHLHDVHLPPDVSWWPPAPGWWILALMSALMVMGVAWQYKLRLLRNDPRQHAQERLDALHTLWQDSQQATHIQTSQNEYLACESENDYLRQSNIILRELAIALAGRTEVASLTGNAWIDWLEHGLKQPLPKEMRLLLGTACYQRSVTVDIENVYTHVQRVIKEFRVLEYRQASRA